MTAGPLDSPPGVRDMPGQGQVGRRTRLGPQQYGFRSAVARGGDDSASVWTCCAEHPGGQAEFDEPRERLQRQAVLFARDARQHHRPRGGGRASHGPDRRGGAVQGT